MNTRESIHQILYRSKINTSMLFQVTSPKKEEFFIPLDGITESMLSLSKKNQLKFVNHCQKLQEKPDELVLFFKRIAESLAKKKL